MPKVALIANSSAGSGAGLNFARESRRHLLGWETEFFFPASKAQLAQVCERIARDRSHDSVFLLGGDGTFQTGLPHFVGSSIPLGVLPLGTANDLARELGFRASPDLLQESLDLKKTGEIDIIEVNGVPFATVGGIGAGTQVLREYERKRKQPWSIPFKLMHQLSQSNVYLLLAAKTILLDQRFHHPVRIFSDQYQGELEAAAVFVCNQASLGEHFEIAPGARNDDGVFDVVVFPSGSGPALLKSMFDLRRGKTPEDVIQFSTRELVLTALDMTQLTAFGDGEILARASELRFKLLPQALRVYRPRAYSARAEARA